jgi:hypothetical protein
VGCARRPVGTYLYLHAVGASNLVAVLGLARWGLNEVPAAIRGINNCREALYGGFWKIITSVLQYMDIPLGQFDMFFRD